MTVNKGKFIVLEGIDGCGKSTQAELLAQHFLNSGQRAALSPEPTDGHIGRLLRKALKEDLFYHKPDNLNLQTAYLFAGDRFDHLYNQVNGVFKLLDEGVNVITTRYYFSSIAYNADTWEQVNLITKLNADFPNPDCLIYIDLPAEEAVERLSCRHSRDTYENELTLMRVRSRYLEILQDYPDELLIVEGNQGIYEIHDAIIEYLNYITFK